MAQSRNSSLPTRAGAPSLTTIPLELRHQIFSYVSERPQGPEKLLRNWFERQEIDQIIASRRAAQANSTEDDDKDDDNGDGEDDEDDDEDMEDDESDEDTQTRVEASTKWRHITSIMRVSRCPPPTSLLLTCKSIHEEAMNWYYDVATLKLNASAGYAHTTFFEEALQQMANAPFSPIENIRRCEVKIFYDSDFISTESQAIPSIFQAMLRIRAELVIELLCQAPGLKYLKLKWYDSSTTPEAITFKRDILDQFDQLFAEITIEEHIIASGTEPSEDSPHGQFRLELADLVTRGHAFN